MQPRAVACVLAACLACSAAQMADNLMVSGSNRPFSEGIGSANRVEDGSASGTMPTVMVSDRASGAYFNDGSGNVTRYDTTGSAMLALARFLGSDISKQVAAGRRLLQQPALTRNASDLVGAGLAAAREYFAEDHQLQHKKGALPSISTQDGNFQIISNNDSGDELQFSKDGTLTLVNGGLSPGIFSIGPNGVTLNKDNALGPVQAMARAVSRAAGNTQADGGSGAAAGAPSAAADTAAAGAGDGSRYDAATNATGTGNPATPAGAGAPPSVAASTAAGPPLTPALQAGSGTPSQADFAAPGVTAASPSLQRAAQTGALEAYEPASVPATSARGAAGVAAAQPGSALRAVTYTGSAYAAPSPAGSGIGEAAAARAPRGGRRMLQK